MCLTVVAECLAARGQEDRLRTALEAMIEPSLDEPGCLAYRPYVDPNEPLQHEGPFGDHTGFYTAESEYPLFHVTAITMRKDAMWQTLLPARSAFATHAFISLSSRKNKPRRNSTKVLDAGPSRPPRRIVRALERGEAIPVRNPASARPWQHVLEPLCGYLTLAAHHYLNHALGVPAKLIGVDVNEEVIRKSSAKAGAMRRRRRFMRARGC